MDRPQLSVVVDVSLVLAIAGATSSCTQWVDTDNVYQGGDLTIFDNTTMAYDTPSDPIAADQDTLDRFMGGDLLYELDRVANPAEIEGTGGLGPLYCGKSCATCHAGTGRTKSTLFTHGGTGYDFSSFLVFMRSTNGQYFPDYGRVLHDHAIFGVEPEGRLTVEYEESCDTFPTEDAEEYCLIRPTYSIGDWFSDAPPEDQLVVSVRTPLRHVGLGLMLACDMAYARAGAKLGTPELNVGLFPMMIAPLILRAAPRSLKTS